MSGNRFCNEDAFKASKGMACGVSALFEFSLTGENAYSKVFSCRMSRPDTHSGSIAGGRASTACCSTPRLNRPFNMATDLPFGCRRARGGVGRGGSAKEEG